MVKYKHGKQTKPISFKDFKKIMEKGHFTEYYRNSHRSYLAFLYWFGVRRAEALERVKEDFLVEDDLLVVDATPKKGGEREPLEVATAFPYVNLIIKQVDHTAPEKRVWPFSAVTAWKIVKRVMPKHYPHFFRLNRATQFLEDPTTTLPEMKAWFGWRQASSVNPYIGYSRRHIRTQRKRLERVLK